ncbi:MAG: aminoacyl-tRNA hydrolase [Phycisphaerales bacterium]
MKLIVGLGNPGAEYARTRHNAGFMAVDRLADAHAAGQIPRSKFRSMVLDASIDGEKCVLMKPTTYMNLSGHAVAEAARFYKLDPSADLLVLVDEVALEVGAIRVRAEGGAGGHNGLASIQQMLGMTEYPRLRIGVGPRPALVSLHDFVLGRFTELEELPLKNALARAVEAVRVFVARGVEAAMNEFNGRPQEAASPWAKSEDPGPPGATGHDRGFAEHEPPPGHGKGTDQ